MGNEHPMFQMYVDKGVSYASEYSRVLISIFTAVIGGLIFLVVEKDVGFWAGVFFLSGALSALMGLSCTLFHMNFTSKVFFVNAHQVLAKDEDMAKLLNVAQRLNVMRDAMFFNQVLFMIGAVSFSVLGFAAILWSQLLWAGICLVLGFVVVLLVAALVGVTRIVKKGGLSPKILRDGDEIK